ncbi:MAG: flagellar filament capping protein FliD [Rickettsiaceae bacterium]|nr:flagellar filament capping protein FliD [Rickettsiaceae bacterium]
MSPAISNIPGLGGNAYSQKSSAQYANKTRSTSRDYTGAFDPKNLNISINDEISLDPLISAKKEKIDKLENQIEVNDKKYQLLNQLKLMCVSLSKAANFLRAPLDVSFNAFAQTGATISTNESNGTAEDYLTVDPGNSLISKSFDVAIDRLATHDVITIGTSNLTEPTSVNTAINGTVTNTTDAAANALAAVGVNVDARGLPVNPYSYQLYQLCLDAIASGGTLGNLKTDAANLLSSMGQMPISFGFTNLSTSAVNTGTKLEPGDYYFYSMPRWQFVPIDIKNLINDANQVNVAIQAIGTDPITRANITAAIAGIGVLTYDVNGLPSNNQFAYDIAYAAWNSAGVGGNVAATVKAAASTVATPLNARLAANNLVNTYGANDEVRKNKWVLDLLDDIQTASVLSGATLASVTTAVNDSFTAYKNYCKVTLVENDTLRDVVDKISKTSAYSGVKAVAEPNGANGYLLLITGLQTGSDYKIGIYNSANVEKTQDLLVNLQSSRSPALKSRIRKGIYPALAPIMHNSNEILDEEQGYTVTLKKVNTTGKYQSIKIDHKSTIPIEYIKQFFSAAEEIYNFIQENSALETSIGYDQMVFYSISDDAVLRDERSVIDGLKYIFDYITLKSVPYNDGGYSSVQDIGISVEESIDNSSKLTTRNTIVIDEEDLDRALKKNYDQVARIFEFRYESSDVSLGVTTHDGNFSDIPKLRVSIHIVGDLGPNNKQVKIEVLNTDNTVAYTIYQDLVGSGAPYMIDCGGGTTDHEIKGLYLSYNSTINKDNIIITLYQGIADWSYGLLIPYAGDNIYSSSHIIGDRLGTLKEVNSGYATDISLLNNEIERMSAQRSEEIGRAKGRADHYIANQKILTAYLDSFTSK